jgi:phage baseplate assembly protein W
MSQSQSLSSLANERFNKVIFSDLDSNFTLDNSPLNISNVGVVNNMIFNVIMTSPGERPFQPTFGCGVPALLFNNITQANALAILNEIVAGLAKWVQFVTVSVQNSQVFADINNGIYYIILSYTITSLPGSFSASLTLASNQ